MTVCNNRVKRQGKQADKHTNIHTNNQMHPSNQQQQQRVVSAGKQAT